MPYRTASDPRLSARPALRSPRPVRRPTLIAASVGAMMLFTFGIELALRPTLGPDEVPDRAPVSYASARTLAVEAHAEGCGGGEDDDEAIYDVNRGLLSDEPMDPEAEPEGTGPARRRYVRPSSNAVVGGVSAGAIEGVTMTLVTDVTDVTARRRRRHPAL